MANIKFFYQNLLKIYTPTETSQHENFPVENLQHRDFNKAWHSQHGAGSGWGNFYFTTANNSFRFEETVGVALNSTLTLGTYTATSLCAHLKTRLEAAGASTYTVTYSDVTNKFTIASDRTGGDNIFKIRSDSDDVLDTLGFLDEDHPDAASHEADEIRIHSEEWLKVDAESAIDVQSFLFKKHNLSTGATAKIQGHTADAWSDPDVNVTLSLTSDITIYYWSSVQSKRWWRYYINDVENSDLYVETGRIFLGGYFSPEVNMRKDYGKRYVDPSELIFSDGGQISTNKKTKYVTMSLVFEYTSAADLATFETMWAALGATEEFFFTRDRDSADDTTIYMRIADMAMEHIQMDDLFVVTLALEQLR